MQELPTSARVRELLDYDPQTGAFTRKVRTAQRHQTGSRADFLITTGIKVGYRRVSIDSQRFLAHRVAWLYVHGDWPAHQIDHLNCDRGDNRIANLRDVPHAVNMQNRRTPRTDNVNDCLGVVFMRSNGKWRARIQLAGKGRHIGVYETKEAAHAAYVNAKRQLHPGCTL